ncbi:MAG TPA: PSD1 and planctomycete cytochrome C domain-containing protein [Gemmataceae bacterium]|nr:PSD1 and planctomycete cytochrome C domain-containing protein [Gemmataceae bacterium]
MNRRSLLTACLAIVELGALAGRAGAEELPRQVYALLQRACWECHGRQQHKGKLRLDTREFALKGGRSGAVIVPGNAEASDLYQRISAAKDSAEVMPPRGEPLSAAQAQLIRDWINQGARWPEGAPSGKHWAYIAPTQPALPTVRDRSWPRNAIDHFILARLEKEKLAPSPEADRAALLRRVSLDLIGLPPSPAEVDAFCADRSSGAYERLVDRLLASPQFGVRWARPWLDYARYADSHGFQRDDFRDLWPYRDWVVNALNADMPFDQFTIEQLAGDLLPGATEEQKIATGFNRSAPTNVEAGSEPEETRVNQVLDRVNTLATVWLGTTLQCVQCHDHKYDPFTMRDYYGLFAFFNNTAIEAERANPKVPGSIAFRGPVLTLSAIGNRLSAIGNRSKTKAESRVPKAESRKPATTLVMQELPKTRMSSVFQRGSYLTPGEKVVPGVPAVLPRLDVPPPKRNRLALARWLVSRDNPLAARVTVNRWWMELFGHGLVRTPEDFGSRGEPPTHPELLDWLAVEFMDKGWSMKKLLRTIVLSATYRQSSRMAPELLARDDANLLYARGPRFRLEAEMIRDNALAIAGLLSLKQGGPPIRPYQPKGLWIKVGGQRYDYVVSPGEEKYRRGLYVVWKRSAPYPSFVSFDANSRMVCRVKRPRSNTPLQALTLLNDPVYVEAATAFARRILRESPGDSVEDRIRYAFRAAVARTPRGDEVAILKRLFIKQRAVVRARSSSEGHSLVDASGSDDTSAEFVAWYAVAAALLNLDETISKG